MNQYKTTLSCLYIFPWLVVSIYSELSSGSIQPPSGANCSYNYKIENLFVNIIKLKHPKSQDFTKKLIISKKNNPS